MKKILILFMCALIATSCEKELESEGIAAGTIAFPSIIVLGPSEVTIIAGEGFEDPGAQAFLGTDEISEQMDIASNVDPNTPGVYSVVYSVSTVNELGDESTVVMQRNVAVVDNSAFDIDLSGTWLGQGFSSAPTPKTITSLGGVWYSCPDVLGSGNNIVAKFAYVGNGQIVVPDQPGGFGNVNTTAAGTYAELYDANSFEWVVFIGCCGNFGPISWTRQ